MATQTQHVGQALEGGQARQQQEETQQSPGIMERLLKGGFRLDSVYFSGNFGACNVLVYLDVMLLVDDITHYSESHLQCDHHREMRPY